MLFFPRGGQNEPAMMAPVFAPDLTVSGLFSRELGPKLVNKRPKLTGKRPKVVNKEPKLTGKRPKVVNKEPKLTGKRPKLVNNGPKLTNKRPKTSGKSLDSTVAINRLCF